jgi:protein-S-isoprenylcysteine O-methyltransferase
MNGATAFLWLCGVWAASQLWIGRRRSGDPHRSRDRGTLSLLIVAIVASLASAAWLAWRDDGQLAARAPWLAWGGTVLMVAGLLLRWWAVRVLGRWFTVDLAVRADQALVRRGPYRVLRHPSYTGALLTVLGFAVGTGQLQAGLVALLPVTAAFLWRIRVEEAMLARAFPDAWPAHARGTWRLLPGIW